MGQHIDGVTVAIGNTESVCSFPSGAYPVTQNSAKIAPKCIIFTTKKFEKQLSPQIHPFVKRGHPSPSIKCLLYIQILASALPHISGRTLLCCCYLCVKVEVVKGCGVVDVACGSGDAQTLCVTDDGDVWSWGDGDYGKLGRGGSDGCKIPIRIESLHGMAVIKVECGSQFSVALTKSGAVYTWQVLFCLYLS